MKLAILYKVYRMYSYTTLYLTSVYIICNYSV